MAGSRAVGQGVRLSLLPLANNKWLYVSLEIMVRTTLDKQLDSASPIASRGRLVCPSVNSTINLKKKLCQDSLMKFSGSAPAFRVYPRSREHQMCEKYI